MVLLSAACAVEPAIDVTAGAIEQAVDLEFSATPEYLARAKSQTTQATSLRFESYTEVESSFVNMGSRTTPNTTGEVSNGRTRTFVDLGNLMGPALAMGGLVDRGDLTMTVVTNGNDAYLQAPFLGAIVELTGMSGTEDAQWMNHLATGWGRLDLDSLGGGGVLEQFGGGATGTGGTELLAVLDSAGEVLDGGQADVRGVSTNVAHANVSFFDLLEQSGQDSSALGMSGADEDILRSLSANVAVYVDDDDMVRRVEFVTDLGAAAGADPSLAGLDMRLWQRVDYFDFDANITIAIPTDYIDITDEFEDFGGF